MNKKGWTISLTGALFFFYSFILANIMTPLSMEITKEFNMAAATISLLSAIYFYANVIFIIPAGLCLDRFSVKKLMLITIFIAILGNLIFAVSSNIFLIAFGRFLCGITMAFGLVSCLKLASLWLASNKMALASSLIITIGMFGGIFAQTPVAVLVKNFGWRNALLIVTFLGVFISFILLLVIKEKKIEENRENKNINIIDSLKRSFSCLQNLYCGFFTSLLNLPIAILGALFGISYLTTVKGISYLSASKIVSMLFIGMIIGSVFFGWFSDYLKRRKVPMYIGGFLSLFLMMFILFFNHLNVTFLYILFFMLGFASSSQVLGYPMISESNPSEITATALSLAAFIIMGLGYGLGIPFVGWLLDITNVYEKAFLVIPIGIVISMVMVFFMKETKCRPIE